MILDYPPLIQGETMSAIRPAYAALQRERGACGAGMYFPFVSNSHANVLHYYFLQQLRGSDCGVLNGMQDMSHVEPLAERFPVTMNYIEQLNQDLVTRVHLKRLADCVPLSFIAFDPHVPHDWVAGTCAELGWQLNPDLTCVSPQKGRPMERLPHTCL